MLPPEEYAETANAVEAPIEAHPDFATFATIANGAIYSPEGKFNGWTKSSPYAGYMTYRVGSVTESTTTYFWSKPESASTLIGTVSGHWRVDSGSIQRRYPYWTRTINRVWSENGWNTTVYPN